MPVATARGELKITDVSLAFGGTRALSNVSLRIAPGLVTGIIGPNGAGKSSLLNCINSLYRPQHGRIELDGQDITDLRPHQVAQRGVARTFQHIELSPDSTALESVLSGRHAHFRLSVIEEMLWIGRGKRQEMAQRAAAEDLLDEFGLHDVRNTPVAELPYGTQKLIDLARAVSVDPAVLLLDEPSSGMTPEEKRLVSDEIQRLKTDRSLTQVVIEHDVGFIVEVCDYLIVLDFGMVIAQGPPREVLRNDVVVAAYLGNVVEPKRGANG